MRKVELRMNEEIKYKTIKKLIETNGNKKKAAVKLNCSIRTIDRLIVLYRTKGKEGFVHGNRGKAPSTAIPLDIKNKIISYYINEYSDTNFTHFCEIVEEDFDVKISDTTLNKWLWEEDIISPKGRRKTKKKLKSKLNKRLNNTKSEKNKNNIKESLEILDSKDAHPRRPRSKYAGEMIQMDASSFEWIPGAIWHLHLAVDDATGEVVGAYFDLQETLNGYYNVFYQILNNYGIPAMFYTDKRTVFEYIKKERAFDDEDTFTQFSYACHTLGVEIKTTSVAQAKGRIERLNQTFQSRLPVELRRAQITTIEQANEFLKSYLKKFNDKFALRLNSTKSVFEMQPADDVINRTLAVFSERKVDSGHCIKFRNSYYKLITENGIQACIKPKSTAIVIEAFDGNLYANVLDNIFIMEKVEDHKKVSRNFDEESKKEKKKKKYIPPLDHPWRQNNILHFKNYMKHLNNGAHV